MTLPLPPVPLEGAVVRLEALTPAHTPALADFALDPALWTWGLTPLATEADVAVYVARAVAEREAGLSVPFAVVLRATGRVVGATRFGSLAPEHGRAEIGWTFYDPAVQGTAVNPDTKRTLLAHAFETWGLTRVEFKTDALNARSRAALRGIGAVEEGILRAHMRTATGRVRDSAYFSILADEWPAVRAHLDAKVAARLAAGGDAAPS
jgi:N-acetyltransferase